jgi:hypothetical protein
MAHSTQAARPACFEDAERILTKAGWRGRVYSVDADGEMVEVLFVTPKGVPKVALMHTDPTGQKHTLKVVDGW